MARKNQTFSRRTKFKSFEETVQKTTNAIVSYEIPKKKFTTNDLKNINPKTYSQERVFDNYRDGSSLILTGSAGTGKTFLGLYLALSDVLSGESNHKKVVIIRSTVSIREAGFLPGDADEKSAIYELPYKALCDDMFKRVGQYEKLKESGVIEFLSTAYVRGSTLKDCVILIDESQNMNWQELSSCMSRAGTNSRYIVCGDTKQSDLLYRKTDISGLAKFIEISKLIPSFRGINFTPEDIVRSGLCKEFILAEERWDSLNSN